MAIMHRLWSASLRFPPASVILTLRKQTLAIEGVRSLVSQTAPSAGGGVSTCPRRRATLSRFSAARLSTLTEEELRRKMDQFNDLFVNARDEMDFASESKETTYFDEEAAAAKEAVDEAVALFESVLSEVDEAKRQEILRGSGLRVEQLKAELEQLLASDEH